MGIWEFFQMGVTNRRVRVQLCLLYGMIEIIIILIVQQVSNNRFVFWKI